jgi:dUTP pyrophosphatase
MEVGITRIREDVTLPEYKTEGAACFDIACADETEIGPGETKYLSTGLVVQTPPGHALIMAPRSSIGKSGIALPNSFGIFDEDYCGPEDELKIIAKNVTDKVVKIEKGQRLVQGYFMKVDHVTWKELKVSEIKQNSRGGIGSTGK